MNRLAILFLLAGLLSTTQDGNVLAQSEESKDLSFAFPDPRPRRRARELGIVIGVMPPGELNAITDVPGVRVGHSTVVLAAVLSRSEKARLAPASRPSFPMKD